MTTATEKDIENLKSQIEDLRSDLSGIADAIKKLSGDAADDGVERIRRATRQTREKARDTLGSLEDEIEDRPLISVAAAFGLGFVLGKLLDS